MLSQRRDSAPDPWFHGLPIYALLPAQERFLEALAGVEDPEVKRKAVGRCSLRSSSARRSASKAWTSWPRARSTRTGLVGAHPGRGDGRAGGPAPGGGRDLFRRAARERLVR